MYEFSSMSEKIYEAAFFPDLWVPILDELSINVGAGVGSIGMRWPQSRTISTTFCIDPTEKWEYSEEALAAWRLKVRSLPEFNRSFVSIDPLEGDWSDLPDFRERLALHIKHGYGPEAGAIFEMFNGEIIRLTLTRRLGQAGFDTKLMAGLNSIYPALRQSIFFASRLQFERSRSSVEALNDFGIPAALLRSNGQLVFGNNLFEGLEHYFTKSASGRLTIRGNDNLSKSFAAALESPNAATLAIPADITRYGAIIHLMPITRDAYSIFSMSGKVMAVVPVTALAGIPSVEITASLFGLTPAEARLSVALASGLSLRDSAANSQIAVGTARQYLNRIFLKTGVSQQSELVSLLKGHTTAGTEGRFTSS